MKDWSQYKPKQFTYINGWIRNWFSNMEVCPIVIEGIIYKSTENYYQAMKSLDPEQHKIIANLSPISSKKAGRKLIIRPDWEDIKYSIMKTALKEKFNIPYWKEKLLNTKDDVLIEWNNWKDKTWGVTIDDCKGNNLLGILLMEIRQELQNN